MGMTKASLDLIARESDLLPFIPRLQTTLES